MKYIRTEEGVYAFKEGMKIRCFYLNYGTKSEPYLIFDDKKQNVEFLGKVIKQSDTIEELCDEFVLDETHYIESDLKEIVLYEKCVGKGLLTTIYGAIWTSKGLIYVAKMNSKGELELL